MEKAKAMKRTKKGAKWSNGRKAETVPHLLRKDGSWLKVPAQVLHGLNMSLLSKHTGSSYEVPDPLLMATKTTNSPPKLLCVVSRLATTLVAGGD